METKASDEILNILGGRAAGCAVALLRAGDDAAQPALERFGAARLCAAAVLDPCRVEHPHSAFLRKPVEVDGKPGVHTTLYAPGGKLHEVRLADGTATERFVKKSGDFETLRGFLRDVELLPAHRPQGAEMLFGAVGRLPAAELEARWADRRLIDLVLSAGDEAVASCLRKLERQFKRRAEEAAALGCCALLTGPLPGEGGDHGVRLLDWLRRVGPVFAEAEPEEALVAPAGGHIGLRCRLADLTDREPPEGARLLLDARPEELAAGAGWLRACGGRLGAVVLLDCEGAGGDGLCAALEGLL